jgi:hypothetical protein
MKATSRFSPLVSRLLLILLAFSPLTASAIIYVDPDSDGVTNLNESITGTSPLLTDSINGLFRAQLSASTSIVGNLDLTWSQLTGKSYHPQKSLDLTSGSKLPFGSSATATVSGGKSLSFQPSGARSFLRIQVSDVDHDGGTP